MRRAACLALLALGLHVAAPLLSAAASSPALMVELCTEHGPVRIQFDAGGAPTSVPGGGHCDLCVCQGMAAAAPFSAPAIRPRGIAQVAPTYPWFVPAPARTASRPRAPPVSS